MTMATVTQPEVGHCWWPWAQEEVEDCLAESSLGSPKASADLRGWAQCQVPWDGGG